jgi:hypothetical protein
VGVVLDPPRFKRDGLKRRAQLMVKVSNQIQICHALLDLRWLGRLRELFHQGKLVGAGFAGDCIARDKHGAPRCRNALGAFQQDLGKHAAGTNVSRKSLRWDWRLEANLNRKANGLALEGPSVGLYVPLLEFNQITNSTKSGERLRDTPSCGSLFECPERQTLTQSGTFKCQDLQLVPFRSRQAMGSTPIVDFTRRWFIQKSIKSVGSLFGRLKVIIA